MSIKIIAKNKRAGYDFFLEEKFEAGIMLTGTEIKSLRLGKVSINEAHVTIDNGGEAWVNNMLIPQYEFGNVHNHKEDRKRKLLLHKHQIKDIHHQMKTKGMTVIPTMIYFSQNRAKLEIALAKGKKKHDKRDVEAKKTVERKIKRGIYE